MANAGRAPRLGCKADSLMKRQFKKKKQTKLKARYNAENKELRETPVVPAIWE